MQKILSFVLLFFCSQVIFGQSEIKTMFYNILNFSSAPPSNRGQILNSILSTYAPDLFMVAEVESQQDAQKILNESFDYTTSDMTQAPFLFNTSGGSYIHQVVYYNTAKFKLNYTDQIQTNIRSINHYSFELKTNSDIILEVFVAHLKASSGDQNEAQRLYEAQQFINYIESFPSSTNILLAGDFNVYSSTEPAFQTLLNGTEAIKMLDPINTPGQWNNNASYAGIHTQSTRRSNQGFDDYGAGGGLDDRFDIMLISEALSSDTNEIYYIENSYKAWGNNGNCFNNNINSIECNGTYSPELREWLYQMSDHLPVVMDFYINDDFLSANSFNDENPITFLNGNLISKHLELKFSPELLSKKVRIYNSLGQQVSAFEISSIEFSLDASTFSTGLYYLKVENTSQVEKFYVKH